MEKIIPLASLSYHVSRDIFKFWENPFSKPHVQKWEKLTLKGSGLSLSMDIFCFEKGFKHFW